MDLIKQYSSDDEEGDSTSDDQPSPSHDSITNLPIYSMNAYSNLKQFNLYTFIPWKPQQVVQTKINDICAQAIKQCDIPDINWVSTNVGNTFIRYHMTLQANAVGKGYQIKQLKDTFKSYLRTNDSISQNDIFTSKKDITKQLKLAQFLNQPPKPPKKFLKFTFKPQLQILPSMSTEKVFLTATFQNTTIFEQLSRVLYNSATDLNVNLLDPIPDQFHVSLQQGDFMSSEKVKSINQKLNHVNLGLENVEFLVNEVTFVVLNNVETVSLIPDKLQELEMENNFDES